jgi:hypothetical protein
MKTISTTAIVALMTATIGLTAIVPTFAQDAAAPTAAPQEQNQNFRQHNQGPRQGGFGDFLGFERGAEAVDLAFVRLSYAVELTAEQQPLFDAFKTAALTAAADFATATEGLRPAAPAEGETAAALPSITDRLENRIAVETARLAALEAVQPAAAAFFDSLTEEQLAALTPQRPDRNGGPGMNKGGPRDHGGDHHQGQMGGKGPMGAPAPADAPAATNG